MLEMNSCCQTVLEGMRHDFSEILLFGFVYFSEILLFGFL